MSAVRRGDELAVIELYRTFSSGIRYYFCRHLGPQELDDRVHDAFIIVLEAIRGGAVREPERLMGFVHTIARRQVSASIERAIHDRGEHLDLDAGAMIPDPKENPERKVMSREDARLLRAALKEISGRDREILTRFYLQEQTQEQICQEMNLSGTQFRLLKSRAKNRFGTTGRRLLGHPAPVGEGLREIAG